MKTLATTVLATVFLCTSAHAQSCKLRNHTGGRTNLRNSALGVERARVIGTLRNGDAVHFIGQSRDRNGNIWSRVTLAAGGPGWVLSRDLICIRGEKAVAARQPIRPAAAEALIAKPETAPEAAQSRQPSPPPADPEPATIGQPTSPPAPPKPELTRLPASLAVAPEPPPLPPRADATASIPKNPELKCELRGQCSSLRQGIDSDDHSCPNGLGVADGTYRLALNAGDKTVIMSRPDLEETTLKLICAGGKCEATRQGADNGTKWTHTLALSDNNRRADYTYKIVSDFGDGMSFAITHVYHGSCAP